MSEIKYTRNDVDYDTWYTSWMKLLAKTHTKLELESMILKGGDGAKKAGKIHLRAIEATTSMTACSARRAHARNVVSACGDRLISLRGAVEIHNLFPEHAKHS